MRGLERGRERAKERGGGGQMKAQQERMIENNILCCRWLLITYLNLCFLMLLFVATSHPKAAYINVHHNYNKPSCTC